MNILIIDGQSYKLVEINVPTFALKSETDKIMNSPVASVTLREAMKFNDKLYAYFPVKIKELEG